MDGWTDRSSRGHSGRSSVLRSESAFESAVAVTAQEPWAPLQVAAVFLRWQTDAESSLMSCQMRVLQRTVQTRIGSAFFLAFFFFKRKLPALLALSLDKSVLTFFHLLRLNHQVGTLWRLDVTETVPVNSAKFSMVRCRLKNRQPLKCRTAFLALICKYLLVHCDIFLMILKSK